MFFIGVALILLAVICHVLSVYLKKKMFKEGVEAGLFVDGLDKYVHYFPLPGQDRRDKEEILMKLPPEERKKFFGSQVQTPRL